MSENPFADDWRDCLKAHYTAVVRAGDRITEPTLTQVMVEAGFSEAALAEMKVLATLRSEDVPEDFVPDLNALAAADEPRVFAAVTVPEAAPAADEAPAAELPLTADEQAAVEELNTEEAPPAEAEVPDDEPDIEAPQQLSLF